MMINDRCSNGILEETELFNPLMECNIDTNVITLINPFSVAYTPDPDEPLSFVLPTVKMPFSI